MVYPVMLIIPEFKCMWVTLNISRKEEFAFPITYFTRKREDLFLICEIFIFRSSGSYDFVKVRCVFHKIVVANRKNKISAAKKLWLIMIFLLNGGDL